MLRAHTAAVVTAVQDLEEARQRVAKSATALSDLVDGMEGPVFGPSLLSVDAGMDLSRRARGIASDVDGEADSTLTSIISCNEIPCLVDDAAELQQLVEFFLTNATTEREEASHAV
jgi:hypothetical protein